MGDRDISSKQKSIQKIIDEKTNLQTQVEVNPETQRFFIWLQENEGIKGFYQNIYSDEEVIRVRQTRLWFKCKNQELAKQNMALVSFWSMMKNSNLSDIINNVQELSYLFNQIKERGELRVTLTLNSGKLITRRLG